MMRLLTVALLGLGVSSAAASDVLLTREQTPAPQRGENIVRHTLEAKFSAGSLRYVATSEAGSSEAISEKYGDYFLGLEFGRPSRTNGGWNLWDFLSATVIHADETFNAQRRYLGDAYILEQGQRTLIGFEWPLADPTADDQTPRLVMLVLHDPAQPEWLFVQVRPTDTATELAQVQLSCFPGNTSGPPERERWVETPAGQLKMTNAASPLPAEAGAIAMFNRYAQEDAGCLLVYLPTEVESLTVRGTYSVNPIFKPRPGVQAMHFALGFFADAEREETVRRFFGEGAPQIAQALAAIDWEPQISYAELDAMVADLEEIVAREANPAQAQTFASLAADYQTAKKDQAHLRVMDLAQQLRAFKEELLAQALQQYQ